MKTTNSTLTLDTSVQLKYLQLLRVMETWVPFFLDRESGLPDDGFTRCGQVRPSQADCGRAI